MTYRDVYVGRLVDRAFDWADRRQDLDRSDIEFLTGSLMDERIFGGVRERVRAGLCHRSLDWGSSVVPTTQQELLSYVAPWEIGQELPDHDDAQHRPRQSRAESKRVIEGLDDAGSYVLVIEEF